MLSSLRSRLSSTPAPVPAASSSSLSRSPPASTPASPLSPASSPSSSPTASFPSTEAEERELRSSLRHHSSLLSASARRGELLSTLSEAHTAILCHNRLCDLHRQRQEHKLQQAVQAGRKGSAERHRLKIAAAVSSRIPLPAFVRSEFATLESLRLQHATLTRDGGSSGDAAAAAAQPEPLSSSFPSTPSLPSSAATPQQQSVGLVYVLQHQLDELNAASARSNSGGSASSSSSLSSSSSSRLQQTDSPAHAQQLLQALQLKARSRTAPAAAAAAQQSSSRRSEHEQPPAYQQPRPAAAPPPLAPLTQRERAEGETQTDFVVVMGDAAAAQQT